jgi:PII-like signaling protein
MRTLDGTQQLARIFLGEHDPWRQVVERLRNDGFAGATVFHGVAGFGAAHVLHTAHLVELSGDLPVIIEVVDDRPHIERLLAILDEMLKDARGLVTIEEVRVVRYGRRAP